MTQADIDSAGVLSPIAEAFDPLTGSDTDGSPVAIATIRLRDTGDERIEDAERKVHELASVSEGRLRVSSISSEVVEDEYKKATEEGVAPLIGLAFLLIAALILLFMRPISDLLLTLAGLLMSIIWIVVAEGWLGPKATSESIISVTVTDAITERQTELISATIAAAFTVLAVFFWVTVRRPALALIAVGPIVLVLISVLGTMALLNIPYTIITSIITALSIGIGVLLASPLAASQQFGFTAATTIAYSLIVSILLVPPAMTIWGAYQNMRLRSMVQNWGTELDEAIDAVYRRQEQ